MEAAIGVGSPNINSLRGKLDNMEKQHTDGNFSAMTAQAVNIATFSLQHSPLPGGFDETMAFVDAVLCYAGIEWDPPENEGDTEILVFQPSNDPQHQTTGNGQVAIYLGKVLSTVVVTAKHLQNHPQGLKLDPYGIPTKLQKLGDAEDINAFFCVVAPTFAHEYLNVARFHNGVAELLEKSSQEVYDYMIANDFCPEVENVSLRRTRGDVVGMIHDGSNTDDTRTPVKGGVGGTVVEFSDFDVRDTQVPAKGGFGSTAVEFTRDRREIVVASRTVRETSAARGQTEVVGFDHNGEACPTTVPPGTIISGHCAPSVKLATASEHTPLEGPVQFTPSNTGKVAPFVGGACGAFGAAGATVTVNTDVDGIAQVCWDVGTVPGNNTLAAVPQTDDTTDLITGVTFVDLDGNPLGAAGVQFQVFVGWTFAGLCDATRAYMNDPRTAERGCSQLSTAESCTGKKDEEKCRGNAINSYINLISAQIGKSITQENAQILIDGANSLR